MEAGAQDLGSCAVGCSQEMNEFPAVFGRGRPGAVVRQ